MALFVKQDKELGPNGLNKQPTKMAGIRDSHQRGVLEHACSEPCMERVSHVPLIGMVVCYGHLSGASACCKGKASQMGQLGWVSPFRPVGEGRWWCVLRSNTKNPEFSWGKSLTW